MLQARYFLLLLLSAAIYARGHHSYNPSHVFYEDDNDLYEELGEFEEADEDGDSPFPAFSIGDTFSSVKKKVVSVVDGAEGAAAKVSSSVKSTIKSADLKLDKAVDIVESAASKVASSVKSTVKNADKAIDKALDSLLGIFPASVEAFLKEHGNKVPRNIVAHRKDLSGGKISALKLLTAGKLKSVQDQLKTQGFDSLFHAWLTVDLGGQSYILEKNQVIKIMPNGHYAQPFDSMPVASSFNGMTLHQIYKRAFEIYGQSFPQQYDPFTNNCQAFVKYMLSAGGLDSLSVKNWILEPTEMLKPAVIPGASRLMTGVIQGYGFADRALQKVSGGKLSLFDDEAAEGQDDFFYNDLMLDDEDFDDLQDIDFDE